MGAAYVFTDRCYVLLDRSGDGKVKVSLAAKPGTSAEAFAAVTGEFENELLAQSLRRQLAERHEKVRELIVARALFGAAPHLEEQAAPAPDDAQLGVDPRYVPASGDDFLEDPLGIAVPWEERYPQAAGETPAVPGTAREGGPGSKP
jgi:His-Xaa-Ser system protein HxsD